MTTALFQYCSTRRLAYVIFSLVQHRGIILTGQPRAHTQIHPEHLCNIQFFPEEIKEREALHVLAKTDY